MNAKRQTNRKINRPNVDRTGDYMATGNDTHLIRCKRCDEGRLATHVVKSELLNTPVCDVCAAAAYDWIRMTKRGEFGQMTITPLETTKHAGG